MAFTTAFALLTAVSGCGSGQSTELTPAEKKNFAGGPRPAGTNDAMQNSIEEFRRTHKPPPPPGGGPTNQGGVSTPGGTQVPPSSGG